MKIKAINEKWVIFYQQHKKLVWIMAGFLLIGLILLAILMLKGTTASSEGITYAEVIRGSLTESIGEVGYVKAEPSAAMTWKSGGIVSGYDLQVGDRVEKDQVLLELEFSSWPNTSLQAQTDLLEAQLELENLVSADTDLQAALLTVTDAEWNLRDKKEDRDAWNWAQSPDVRIDSVRSAYLASVQNYWLADAEYETLRLTLEKDDPDLVAAYEALQDADLERDKLLRAFNQILGHPYDQDVEADFIEYDQALDDLEVARLEYERQLDNSQEIAAAKARVQALENTVNNARILAPFDGTITSIAYLPGEHAESGEVAIQIDDLDNLVVNTTVSEVDIAKVATGQQVAVTFGAIPYKEYNGIVTRIASAGSDSNGAVTFDVTIGITDADAAVKPGFSADISIITSQADDALLVPNEALLGQNGNYRVLVVGAEGTPSPVMVEIGGQSDTHTEILNGDLEVGDRLVIAASTNSFQFGGGGFGLMGGIGQISGGGGGGGGGSGSGK